MEDEPKRNDILFFLSFVDFEIRLFGLLEGGEEGDAEGDGQADDVFALFPTLSGLGISCPASRLMVGLSDSRYIMLQCYMQPLCYIHVQNNTWNSQRLPLLRMMLHDPNFFLLFASVNAALN